jgi:hypothetical protein
MRKIAIVLLLVLTGCQSSAGTALTAEGGTLRLSVFAPPELAEGGAGAIDVLVGNRGFGTVSNVFVEVELPPQVAVTKEVHGTGVNLIRDARANVYHYSINALAVGSDARLHLDVQAHFGGAAQTGPIRVRASQVDVSGDQLERTAVIRMAAK